MKRDQISVLVNNIDTNQAGAFKQVHRYRKAPQPQRPKHVTVRLSKQNQDKVFERRIAPGKNNHGSSLHSMVELLSEDETSEHGRSSIDSPDLKHHRKANSMHSGAFDRHK